eukprot:scaffold51248_cov68-Phaeocystis_antarctica.AAC.2
MGPGAPGRSTRRPALPPASRAGPAPPRRSARAARRTARASCPGPACKYSHTEPMPPPFYLRLVVPRRAQVGARAPMATQPH